MTLYFVMLRSDYAARWGEDPVRGIKLTLEAAEAYLVEHAKYHYNGQTRSLYISEKEIDLGTNDLPGNGYDY